MNEREIMYLCRKLGGTVYETIKMADQDTLVALMEFIKERVSSEYVKEFALNKSRSLLDECPEILIKRVRPILVELLEDCGRSPHYHPNCPPGMNMGQFLSLTIAIVRDSCKDSSEMTKEIKEFIEQTKALGSGFG
ncbi:MAG: hypothetical protein Q8O59_04235 [bacterium]|nr:hypothetical protein [bacterium]